MKIWIQSLLEKSKVKRLGYRSFHIWYWRWRNLEEIPLFICGHVSADMVIMMMFFDQVLDRPKFRSLKSKTRMHIIYNFRRSSFRHRPPSITHGHGESSLYWSLPSDLDAYQWGTVRGGLLVWLLFIPCFPAARSRGLFHKIYCIPA